MQKRIWLQEIQVSDQVCDWNSLWLEDDGKTLVLFGDFRYTKSLLKLSTCGMISIRAAGLYAVWKLLKVALLGMSVWQWHWSAYLLYGSSIFVVVLETDLFMISIVLHGVIGKTWIHMSTYCISKHWFVMGRIIWCMSAQERYETGLSRWPGSGNSSDVWSDFSWKLQTYCWLLQYLQTSLEQVHVWQKKSCKTNGAGIIDEPVCLQWILCLLGGVSSICYQLHRDSEWGQALMIRVWWGFCSPCNCNYNVDNLYPSRGSVHRISRNCFNRWRRSRGQHENWACTWSRYQR